MKKKKETKAAGDDVYARAGVNLAAGDVFSAYAGEIGRGSFDNSPYVKVVDSSKGHFRGPRGWNYVGLPEGYFNICAPDGIGTATIIVSAAEAFDTTASRLIAMTAGDITRFGGLPLMFTNILEAKSLGEPGSILFSRFQRIMAGLGEYAMKQKFVLIGGETAEMGVCVGSEISEDNPEHPIFNWSGVMFGVAHPDKMITGDSLAPGQRIIALRDGLRSNGGSAVRLYLRERHGPDWWNFFGANQMIKDAAAPAVLYDHFLATMNGWYNGPSFAPLIKMHAIAHITGGGIEGKFAHDILFRQGLSAELYDLWTPPDFMLRCVSEMKMTDHKAYSTFNGGQGALVVVDESAVEPFCYHAQSFGIEAQEAGMIIPTPKKRKVAAKPFVCIHSKFSSRKFVIE